MRKVGTHNELERSGCAITRRVRNCCTNWLSSTQHIIWVSRSGLERSTTPYRLISWYSSMERPFGDDTRKLLVYNGSRGGMDVPKDSCGGTVCDGSNVTTQLARSEKLRYVSFNCPRGCLTGAMDSPMGSSSY